MLTKRNESTLNFGWLNWSKLQVILVAAGAAVLISCEARRDYQLVNVGEYNPYVSNRVETDRMAVDRLGLGETLDKIDLNKKYLYVFENYGYGWSFSGKVSLESLGFELGQREEFLIELRNDSVLIASDTPSDYVDMYVAVAVFGDDYLVVNWQSPCSMLDESAKYAHDSMRYSFPVKILELLNNNLRADCD
ncbi:MAG: hypothetical protein RLY93_17495 [Sumerlaeia bacterium]